ncbi:hypothetical protein PUN28_017386 [Cardiocondyla obscurior]|uniref:39S ribosomal protein L1, mitochondrial n=1 Tax=Cardiocondyla obscurior TaxID=286306 RepID=A0AAW2EMT5_9HYME
MAAAVNGWLLNNFAATYKHVTYLNFCPINFLQARNYAARKGTREKARKKKVKVVVEKVGFIPHDQRALARDKNKKKLEEKDIIFDDSKKPDPEDNVWICERHKLKIYSFEEAIQSHRETHHPTIYNMPNAPISAFIELDMQGVKKTKFVDTFSRVVCLPHTFNHGQNRKILAFCKTTEMEDIAKEAGADFTGGKPLIKQVQNGAFSVKDYDVIVSEPSILPDLLLVRGLMKKNFPSIKLGTLNSDIKMVVNKFRNGIKYTAKPHDLLKSYGTTDVIFGTLDMDTKQLEENFAAIVLDINNAKPKRPGPFITRTRIICPPSPEQLKVDFEQYLPKVIEAEEEVDEKQDAVIASH